MVNSFSSGKGHLVEPPFGSYIDQWQLPVNSNFGLTDALVSGTTTIDLSTVPSTTPSVTLVFADFDTTQTPWNVPLAGQNLRIKLVGALSFDVSVLIPKDVPGFWIFDNQTSNSYKVNVLTTASLSQGITISQGYMTILFSDGTNVNFADLGNIVAHSVQGTPSGMIFTFGGATAPSGYLECNGAAVSRTTYAALFTAIGTAWGAGDGSTTFNVPDLRGMFVRGSGTNGTGTSAGAVGPAVGTYVADGVGPITLNDPGHFHMAGSYKYGGGFGNGNTPSTDVTSTDKTGITITGTISETRPKNYGILYCIKT